MSFNASDFFLPQRSQRAQRFLNDGVAVVLHGRTVNEPDDGSLVGWALPTVAHVGQCPSYGYVCNKS